MSSEERQPNALMQQINSQSAAMQSPFGQQNSSPVVPGQDATGNQPQPDPAQSRVLVPDSSPDHKSRQQSSLPPGGFTLPDQSNGFGQGFPSTSMPNFNHSQGRPPPEQMLNPNSMYASNGRADGQPPPRKKLVRLGDVERSQSPADMAINHSATPNFSRSSSSDTIASQMNQFSILSQQNSASGSPAPSGSPALGGVGPDFFGDGLGQINGMASLNSSQPSQSAPQQQQQDPSSSYQNGAQSQPGSDEVYSRFKVAWPHLSEEQVRDALKKSNNDPVAATNLLCNSNPLLDGYNASPSPAPAVPPQNSNGQQRPLSGSPYPNMPPQQQYPSSAPMSAGIQSGFPRMPSHPHQQQVPPHMQMSHMQQRPPYQQANNTMFLPPGGHRPGINPPNQYYPGNPMYRAGPPQAISQQSQQMQHPMQHPQQPRPGPGFNPVSTRTVMQQPGMPQINQQQLMAFMAQHRLDFNNPGHRQQAMQSIMSHMQQQRRVPQQGMSSLDAQRQMLQNPAELERMRQQQNAAHMAAQANQQKQQARQGVGKNAVSKLVAAHRPQAASASSSTAVRKQKRKHADSDSEDGGNWSDGSDGGAKYEEYVNVEKEGEALNFFNTCAPEQLPDYTACTPEAAQAIVSLRPFDSPDDIRAKLKKTKGISNKLFDSVVDVFEAYQHVDRVFAECSQYGRDLSHVMRIWSGVSKQARAGKPEDTRSLLMPGQANDPTREGTPDIETGVHLVELDEAALDLSRLPTAPPEIQMAFADYIREKPVGVPENIQLKGYQMLGINWLNLLYKKRLSCILADEMGLGKTCQVISFLAHLKATNHPGPHLIIVPSSTLDNWLREFDTFAPDLKAFPYYGSQAAREDLRTDLKAEQNLDVIVTTYNMASGNQDDRKFLKKMNFKTCVYDEGHQLKNSESKKYKDLMELRVPWRLLLTGTPLQNNLTELISLLSFILPNTFSQVQDSLKAIFKVPPAAQANMLSRRRIESAKKVMTPFVLRRKKYQVLQELPAKREQIIHCEMTPEQKALYRESMQKSKRFLAEEQEEEALPDDASKKARGRQAKKPVTKQAENSSNILMDLRKAANHPMLFRRLFDDKKIAAMSKDCLKELEWADKDPKYIEEDMSIMTDYELHRFVQPYKHLVKHALEDDPWMHSGKVEWLSQNILEMRERGDRILLFSQFTQVLDLLEAVLGTLGVRYLKLTGQTNVAERQDLVDEFYADEGITVFLLSTRAGGLGLNLAAANVVILHDQDFNPHNDKQAEDRAWRIGQTRDVNVIRLVMKDTIEEDILAMATTKLTLDSEISKVEGEEPSAAGAEAREGDESITEKKVKSSLLRNIRAKLEQAEGEEAKAQAMSQLAVAQQPAGSEIKVEQ